MDRSRTLIRPGVAVARGVVHEAASLAVNGGEPTLLRSGERWVWERAVGNGSGPAWQAVDVTATRAGAGPGGGDVTTARSGAVYVPPAAEAPAHDADGNLTGDGRWMYSWDGENRLIAMETQPALVNAGAPRQRLEFGYDAQHRRVSKVVKQWDTATGAFLPQSRTTFVYDGWNLIAEFETNQQSGIRNLKSSYEWGLDVSGTMSGAGGVGGLLIIRSYTRATASNSQPLQATQTSAHAPCYDGNGNIAALVNLATGQTEARYDYGPFGERVLAAGGAIAEANPFRFSTKYEDAETGLLYYGYRFYDPVAGRWVNRDPIGERGGVNLYSTAYNDLVIFVDGDGRLIIGPYSGPQNNHKPVDPATIQDEDDPEFHTLGLTTADWQADASFMQREEDDFIFTVSGSLNVDISLDQNANPAGNIDRLGNTLLQHEREHERIYQKWFNKWRSLADPYDGSIVCTEECAEHLKGYVLNKSDEYKNRAEQENESFDSQAYHNQAQSQERAQGAANYGAFADQAAQIAQEHLNQFRAKKCKVEEAP